MSPVVESTLLPVTCRSFKLFIKNPRTFLDKRKKWAYQWSESDGEAVLRRLKPSAATSDFLKLNFHLVLFSDAP